MGGRRPGPPPGLVPAKLGEIYQRIDRPSVGGWEWVGLGGSGWEGVGLFGWVGEGLARWVGRGAAMGGPGPPHTLRTRPESCVPGALDPVCGAMRKAG